MEDEKKNRIKGEKRKRRENGERNERNTKTWTGIKRKKIDKEKVNNEGET